MTSDSKISERWKVDEASEKNDKGETDARGRPLASLSAIDRK